MTGTVIAAIAVIILATAYAVIQRRSGANASRAKSSLKDAPAHTKRDEAVSIDHAKLVIHGLLQSVSDNIEAFVEENIKFDDSIQSHKAGVSRATTLSGIQEVERVLIEELNALRSTNAKYRSQLDSANQTIGNQKSELEKLQADVGVDFLTEIPNRRSFDERIKETFDHTHRYGNVFSLLLIDVDHFKNVNDAFGHLAGDRILRALSRLLHENKRSTDFLARFGGEEFALILPETNSEQATRLAENICKRVERAKFIYEKMSIGVTISIGVGEVSARTDSAKKLFERVDAALYKAKDRGRNCVVAAPMTLQKD